MDIAPLDQVGWLANQSQEFRQWVAMAGQWRSYAPGQFLYHAGDAPNGLYGLAHGGLEITFPLVAEEPVMIYRAEVGFWIGDSAELAEEPRTVSVMAAAPSRVLRLPGPAIRALLAKHSQHWRAFYRLSARNATMVSELLSEALALTVRARACRRLVSLAAASGEVSITQEDLAKLLGVTRTTLRRCLTDLTDRGAIETRYGKLRLLDIEVLRSFKDEQ